MISLIRCVVVASTVTAFAAGAPAAVEDERELVAVLAKAFDQARALVTHPESPPCRLRHDAKTYVWVRLGLGRLRNQPDGESLVAAMAALDAACVGAVRGPGPVRVGGPADAAEQKALEQRLSFEVVQLWLGIKASFDKRGVTGPDDDVRLERMADEPGVFATLSGALRRLRRLAQGPAAFQTKGLDWVDASTRTWLLALEHSQRRSDATRAWRQALLSPDAITHRSSEVPSQVAEVLARTPPSHWLQVSANAPADHFVFSPHGRDVWPGRNEGCDGARPAKYVWGFDRQLGFGPFAVRSFSNCSPPRALAAGTPVVVWEQLTSGTLVVVTADGGRYEGFGRAGSAQAWSSVLEPWLPRVYEPAPVPHLSEAWFLAWGPEGATAHGLAGFSTKLVEALAAKANATARCHHDVTARFERTLAPLERQREDLLERGLDSQRLWRKIDDAREAEQRAHLEECRRQGDAQAQAMAAIQREYEEARREAWARIKPVLPSSPSAE